LRHRRRHAQRPDGAGDQARREPGCLGTRRRDQAFRRRRAAGKATKDELTGSTITITSLGAIGGIVTTPVINHPETAIIGVNKMQTLPRYDAVAASCRARS
jgi:pyruvate/2-oxoglutarate dehydrogenase complex dihydrolipoamide acyltransferase (E2) component